MHEINVSIEIEAPIEKVFEALSDHESFLAGPGMSCALTKEGQPNRNGLGALRQIEAGNKKFTEQITAFETPNHYEYVIQSLTTKSGRKIPFQHERGWLDFSVKNGKTVVEWTTRFRINIPLIGGFISRRVGSNLIQAFNDMLQTAKNQLEETQRAVNT